MRAARARAGGTPARDLGAARALHVGEPVWAFGFEGGLRLQVRTGIVRALHAYDDGWVVESTTPFTSGASGGALFDGDGPAGRHSHVSVARRSPILFLGAGGMVRCSAWRPSDSYAAVMPLPSASPFWERANMDLPYFLRAHQLELGGDWNALLKLTDEWSKADAGNAEAVAVPQPEPRRRRRTCRPRRPRSSMRSTLDPVSASAWLELGRLSAHRGSMHEAQAALAHLNSFSPELARCLAQELTFEFEPADADAENCSSM